MRALLAFVVMCLVSAVRPAPIANVIDEAKVDATKSQADFVPSRRVSVEPRNTRTPDVVATIPRPIPPPSRFAIVELHALAGRDTIPVVFARSARGPPVG